MAGGRSRWGALVLAGAMLGMVGVPAANAKPPQTIAVEGAAGGCPSETAVATALSRLVSSVAVVAGAGTRGAIVAEVFDRGRAYRVRVAGRERELSDPERRCAERATTAAVLIAMTVAPPAIALPFLTTSSAGATLSPSSPALPSSAPAPTIVVANATEPTVSPAPPASAPASPPSPPAEASPLRGVASSGSPLVFSPEIGGVVAAAPGATTVAGAVLGASLMGATLGVAVDAWVTTPADLGFSAARIRVSRLPFDAALRVHRWFGAWDVAGGAGLAAAVTTAEAADIPLPTSTTRLELGVSLAGRVALHLRSRVVPFLGLQAAYFPRPYDLVVEPQGVAGRTPALWIGCTAGAAVTFE